MTYAYEDLYRRTRLLVDAYVETRRGGKSLSAQDLAQDPSVVRAMQVLHRDIVNLPPSEQVALYGRMVRDAVKVALSEAEEPGIDSASRLQLALGLIDGYSRNLLDAAHQAIDGPSGTSSDHDDEDDDDED